MQLEYLSNITQNTYRYAQLENFGLGQ